MVYIYVIYIYVFFFIYHKLYVLHCIQYNVSVLEPVFWVNPIQSAHSFAVFFFIFLKFLLDYQFSLIYVINLPIFFRVASLALGQSYDCPSASEATLKKMGQTSLYQATTKHHKM